MRRLSLTAVLLVGAVALSRCNDSELPHYDVQPPVLRLIPDQSSVGAEGGYVFVVVELTPADGGLEPRTVFLRADGAKSTALPGPSFCVVTDAGTAPPPADAGTLADGGTTVPAKDGGTLFVGPTELVFPYSAFRHNESRHTDETGVLVTIPAGNTDVAVVAAAYHATDDTTCSTPNSQLEAMAFVRITRTAPGTPDSGTATASDAGGADGGETPDGGTAPDSGEADAGTSETDAGTPDAGPVDAGAVDAGNADGGDAG